MKKSTRFLALCAILLTVSFFSTPLFQPLSAQQDEVTLRALYNDPEQFEMLSGAAQNLLEIKFGRKRRNTPSDPHVGFAPPGENLADHQQAQAQSEPESGSRILMALDNPTVNDRWLDSTARDTQSETTIAFGSGTNLIVGYNDSGSVTPPIGIFPNNKFTGFSRSFNSGAIWRDEGTLTTNPTGDAGDPVLARWDLSGKLYLATLAFSGTGLQVFRSDDDAATWTLPTNAAPGVSGFQDKPWIAVDNALGPNNGMVYVAWRSFNSGVLQGIRFTRSIDGGASFEPTGGLLIASPGAGGVQGAWVTVGPDHAVYVFWLDQSAGGGTPNIIRMRKSTDQGATFGMPTTVATLLTTAVNGSLGVVGGFRTNAFPQVVVNPTNPNNLYIVYNDNPAGVDSGNIYFRQSIDGGATWSSQVQLNGDATTNLQWFPAIAVTPDGSRLAVSWYDRRRDPADRLIERWGVIGNISGTTVTFGPNFRISDQFPPVFGVDPVVNTVYMGDYDTMIADNQFFYGTWGDNRDPATFAGATRNTPDVRFAKIPITGPGPILDRQSFSISGGDGDMLLEPNECINLNVTIINDGAASAMGITAELTSFTNGVNITQGVSNYLNLAPGATGTNLTPFQISISPDFPCGVEIVLRLVLNYAGGSDKLFLTLAPSDYLITSSTGAAIVPGTTDIGNHGVDVITTIALPFSYSLYDQSFASVQASSNGNLQFISSSTAFLNSCPLPTPVFNFAIMPHWEDQRTDLTFGGGIFTSVSGSAPNRIFNIEWRTVYFNNTAQRANFEVRLYEGQQRFDVVYGVLDQGGSSASVGVQRDSGSRFTQFSCDTPGSLSPGLQLVFQIPSCGSGPGVCPNSFTGSEQANLGFSALGANQFRIRPRDIGSALATLLRYPGPSPRK